jgi:UDP-N-acetylglucosamine acyltransferase
VRSSWRQQIHFTRSAAATIVGHVAIHRTALVDPRAEIGPDVEIGPFTIVEGDVRIGAGCRIGAHVTLKRYTTLGQRNHIYAHAVLGGEPQHTDFHAEGSSLLAGDDNVIREHVTIHRASGEGGITRLGSRNRLLVGAHVAHNCIIGSDCEIGTNAMLGGFVTIEDHAVLGYAMGIHQFVRVGRYAVLGNHAKIVQDALPYVVTRGDPCRVRGVNTSGLERAGCSAAERANFEQAVNLLLHSSLSRADALTEMARLNDTSVAELATFVRGSARGFTRAPRKQRPATPAPAAA